MTLYELLEVERTATAEEIKRAYFRLVRRFTPEKAPEEFMRIRRAYEELSDEEAREEYDEALLRFADVPDDVMDTLMEAERLSGKLLTADSIRMLEQRLKDFKSGSKQACAILYALSQEYLEIGKTGKAVEIAEELARDYPDNVKYLRLAAEACQERGWTKKAYGYLSELLKLDPGSEDDVLTFFERMDKRASALGKLVETIEMHGGTAPILCGALLCECLMSDPEVVDADMYEQMDLFAEAGSDEKPWHDIAFAAKKLAEHTVNVSKVKKAALDTFLTVGILRRMYATDHYDIMPHIDRVIENIGAEEIFQTEGYLLCATAYDAIEAVRAGIPKMLAGHSVMRFFSQIEIVEEYEREDYRNEVIAFEVDIMSSYTQLKKGLKRYREEFKELYRHSASFLDAVQRYNEDKYISEFNRRITKLRHIESRLTLEWLGKDDDFGATAAGSDEDAPQRSEPVRVTKIGRNEPCPCGSGKKYKKCCGM